MASSEVISEIGIEITEFHTKMVKVAQVTDAATASTKAMDKATKDAAKSRASAAKIAEAAGKKTAYQTGQVAMQLQDVAVQAQTGTGALQIFAQQGSQVASVFGGMKGAMVGGILAIGTALASAVIESEKTFANMINGVNTLENELSGIAGNGSLNAVVKGFEKSADVVGKLTEDVESLNGFWRATWEDSKAILTLGYTDTQLQKIAATEKEISDLSANNARLMERFKVTATESIKIATLRASGENDAADALERQVKLKERLEAITDGKGNDESKVRQKDLARELARLEELRIANEKAADEKKDAEEAAAKVAKENAEWEKMIANEEFRAMTDFYSEQEKLEAKAAKEKEDGERAALKFAQDNDEFNNAMRKRSDASVKEKLDAAEKLAGAEAEAAENRKESLADAIRETQLMQAQAHGTDLQSKLLRNQLEYEEKIAQAKKDGNDELQKQLRIQRGIADMEAKIDNKLKTPAQRREEKREQKKRDIAERKIRAKEIRDGVPQIGGVEPRPIAQPNGPAMPFNPAQPAQAPVMAMHVTHLIVGELKPK